MKKVLLLVTIMTADVFAVGREDLVPLIGAAATNRESAYLEVRNKILEYGTNALPLLAEFAVDGSLPWQQQLVARICYERIERKEEIERLLETDWYKHPKFNPEWWRPLPGPEWAIGSIVMPELQTAGLWYYCLELLWKDTGEEGKIRRNRFDDFWARWCASVVKDNPEERVWFLRVCSEILKDVPPDPADPPPRIRWLHDVLFDEKRPDAAPLLLQYFIQRAYKGDDIARFVFVLTEYADARSADVLERLAASYQKSEDFAPHVAGLRTRRAPPASEQPFRLGTNIVRRAKQP